MLSGAYKGTTLSLSGSAPSGVELRWEAGGIVTAWTAGDAADVLFTGIYSDMQRIDSWRLTGGPTIAVVAAAGALLTTSWLNDRLSVDIDAVGTGGVSFWGRAGDDWLTGGLGADSLRGDDGQDTVDGGGGDDSLAGGAGDDVLIGGAGIDTAFYDGTAAVIVDLSTGLAEGVLGRDTLSGIEVIVAGGGADRLTGDAGRNTLDGGAGADTLAGGMGDDDYVLDSIDDVVIEAADGGWDRVLTSLAWTLQDGVEELVLTGRAAIDGIGNGGDNRLTGNDADNRLDGGAGDDTLIGGGGTDLLIGGAGNDTYQADARDRIMEEDGGGIDSVLTTTSWTLLPTLETLRLIGTAGAALTGNAGANLIEGNVGADTLSGGGGADTLVGGDGDDLYDWAPGVTVIERIGGGRDTLLAAGDAVLMAGVEVLQLSDAGSFRGTGNAGDNLILGGIGNDTLAGGGGRDTLAGGAGDDTYVIAPGSPPVTIVEATDAGRDTLWSSVSMTLAAGLENLVLTGAAGLSGTGNAADNIITGGAGGDTLIGGAGSDTLIGGAGADLYYTDGADLVIEGADAAVDTVVCSGSIDLGPGVEVLVLSGAGATTGRGNAGGNRIHGNIGDNVIDGRGGNDTMIGGAGNDVYVSDGGDLIVESPGGGAADTILASASITLPPEVERLLLAAGGAWSGTGNGGANLIIGNDQGNLLDGRYGADSLYGGAGNDIYVMDPADTVVESPGAGWDTVWTGYTCRLPDNVEVLGLGGTGAINGYGNALANRLNGNAAANRLEGGAGNDTLAGLGGYDTLLGGAGNDIYLRDGADTVIEAPGGGIDAVYSSSSWTMAAEVETLVLTGMAVAGYGNALANRITGNAAANVLLGGAGNDWLDGGAGNDRLVGGAGADVLIGGLGADRFVFAAGGGVDTVWGFQNGIDRFEVASGADSFRQLSLRQVGAHVQVGLADGSGFTVLNTALHAIDAADFVFT